MRQNKKNKGFTLVELLIVVAIIGILAAVLTPQFLNARRVAVDRSADAIAHNVYTAMQADLASGETDIGTCAKTGYTSSSSNFNVTFSGVDVTDCTITYDNNTDELTVSIEYDGGTSSPSTLP